jgi:putative peptidoglycan lipid II flippase
VTIDTLTQTIRLAAISAAARLPSFLLPLVIAGIFGAGIETDAYFVAYAAALLVGGTLAQAIEVAIVPFAVHEGRRPDGASHVFLRKSALGVTTVAVALWAFGIGILALTTTRAMSTQTLRYALALTPLVILWSATSVYSGALVAYHRIETAIGSLMLRALGALTLLILLPRGAGLFAVALGLGIGELARLLYVRYHARMVIPQSSGSAVPIQTAFGRAATLQVAAATSAGVPPLVERLIAPRVAVGAASFLEYATRLLVIPTVIFDGAIAPLLLTRWSHDIASGAMPTRATVFREVARGIAIASGCAAAVAVLARPGVQVLLGHGRLTENDVRAIAALLQALSVGFIGTMGALLAERAYLASSRNHLLAMLALVRAGVRIVTTLVSLKPLGIYAFAVGYAVGDWCYLVGLLSFWRTARVRDNAVANAEVR